ncbi:unnamed protein product, partial [Prorocentrum cordatum]
MVTMTITSPWIDEVMVTMTTTSPWIDEVMVIVTITSSTHGEVMVMATITSSPIDAGCDRGGRESGHPNWCAQRLMGRVGGQDEVQSTPKRVRIGIAMTSAAAAPTARASCLATFKGVVDFARAVTAQMEDADRAQMIERQVAHVKMIVRRGGCARDDATQTVHAINATDILTAAQKRELITAVTESVTMDIAMTGKRDGRNFNVQYQTHQYPEHYLTTEMWALLQDPHLGVEAKLDKVGEYFVHTLCLHYPDQKTVPRLAALVVASEIAAGRGPTPAQAFEYKN